MRENQPIPHDPEAVLDYRWDWTAWLPEGDEISSATVTSEQVTVGAVTHDANSVTAWISGGTVNTAALVVCHVTTTQGRQDDRTMLLQIQHR